MRRLTLNASEIAFDPVLHEYRVGEERWPSVTEVLDPLLELGGIPWATLKAAAEFGNHVHQATHLLDIGRLDVAKLDPALAPYVSQWSRFVRDANAIVVASELRVGSATHKVAGTLDRKIRMLGSTWVVDLKTSAAVPPTAGPQTAAYERLDAELEGRGRQLKRGVVHLGPDNYRFHRLTDPADWNTFLSALNVHRFREKHGTLRRPDR